MITDTGESFEKRYHIFVKRSQNAYALTQSMSNESFAGSGHELSWVHGVLIRFCNQLTSRIWTQMKRFQT